MIKELQGNYKEVLEQEDRPYLLEIYTPTCGVCQQVMPFVQELAQEQSDQYGFYKINAHEVTDVGQEYGISSVPALFFVKDGQTLEKHVGYITKDEIQEKLEKHFG